MFWNQFNANISPTMIPGKNVFSALVLAVLCQSALVADANRFVTAHRISVNPIIRAGMLAGNDGANINGILAHTRASESGIRISELKSKP